MEDSNTKLLSHFDIPKATSVLAATGQTITYIGTADCQTTTKKWTGSLLLDGNSDYVTIPDSADWTFGTGDFTIDFWVNFAALGEVDQGFVGQAVSGNDNWSFFKTRETAGGNKLFFFARMSSVTLANYIMTNNWAPNIGQWYHIALVRNTTNIYIFIDGFSQALTVNTAIGTSDLTDIAVDLDIGYRRFDGYTGLVNGYIDEFRISKGIARWTSDFTPPTSEYSISSVKSYMGVPQTSILTALSEPIASVKNIMGVVNN